MAVYFTSDLHLGHRFVAGLRGFEDPDTHDDAIAGAWEATVGKNDVVWVLGDVSMDSTRAVEHALGILADLPGEKHLIAGNHDRCHPWRRDAHLRQRRYLEVFDSVASAARRRIGGTEVLLSHFPYHVDHTDSPRYNQWRLRDEGLWLLHGHTHGPERAKPASREIHVGWDAWGSLVPLETLDALIHSPAQKGA